MSKVSRPASAAAPPRRAARKQTTPEITARRIIPAPDRVAPIILRGAVRGLVVTDPSSEPVLADFMCAALAKTPDELEAAADVKNIAREAHAGAYCDERLAVLKTPADATIGFVLVRMMGHSEEYPHERGPSIMDAPYIGAVGRLDSLANHRLSDGRTSVGAALMRLIHDVVALEVDGRPFPAVCARVLPGNDRSHRAFDASGYLNYPKSHTGRAKQDIRWRPASPPEPRLDPSVYLPPETLPGGPRLGTIMRPIKRLNLPTGRNAPCPCGSGRKYKKCCGF